MTGDDSDGGSDIDEATIQDVVRAIRDCKGHYSFLIGAGASKPAGIPTAGDLIWEWKQERYTEEHGRSSEDSDDETIDDWAEEYESKNMDEQQNSYGFWFEQVHTTPGQRRQFIQEKVENKDPTFGNIVLASLMADEYIPLTLTPNFDDLVYDALYRFLEEKPLVINRDAVAAEFSLTKERPTIIKLHGDYLFENLQNLTNETNKLQENMERAFSLALNEYGLIVVGYGGTDKSIMDEVILNDIDIPEYGIYWCVRDQDNLSLKAERLLERENTYLVEINGSESFFAKLANRIPGVSPPDREDLRQNVENKIEAMERTIEQGEKEAESEEVESYLDVLGYQPEALDYIEDQNWNKLEEIGSKMVSAAPGRPEGYFYKGYSYNELGEYERAIDMYDKAINIDSELTEAYYNRGTAYNALGKQKRAIEDHNKAIELDPEDEAGYINRGTSYMALGKHDKAISDFDKAIELSPDYHLGYVNRSEAYLVRGEHEKAKRDAKKAYELATDDSEVATPLLQLLIVKTVLGEETDRLKEQYQNVCTSEFSLTWDPSPTKRWIREADIDENKKEYINKLISSLEEHSHRA